MLRSFLIIIYLFFNCKTYEIKSTGKTEFPLDIRNQVEEPLDPGLLPASFATGEIKKKMGFLDYLEDFKFYSGFSINSIPENMNFEISEKSGKAFLGRYSTVVTEPGKKKIQIYDKNKKFFSDLNLNLKIGKLENLSILTDTSNLIREKRVWKELKCKYHRENSICFLTGNIISSELEMQIESENKNYSLMLISGDITVGFEVFGEEFKIYQTPSFKKDIGTYIYKDQKIKLKLLKEKNSVYIYLDDTFLKEVYFDLSNHYKILITSKNPGKVDSVIQTLKINQPKNRILEIFNVQKNLRTFIQSDAQEKFLSGDFSGAILESQRDINSYKLPEHYIIIALSEFKLGKIEKSIQALSDGIKEFPSSRILKIFRARFFSYSGKFKEALKDLEEFNSEDSTFPFLMEEGILFALSGKGSESIKFLKELKYEQENKRLQARYFLEISEILKSMKRNQEADEYVRKLSAIYPELEIEAHLTQKKKYDIIIEEARNAIKSGDYDSVLMELQNLVFSHPNEKEPYLLIGKAYYKIGNMIASEETLNSFLDLGGKDVYANLYLSDSFLQNGKINKAKEFAEKSLKEYKNQIGFYETLIQVCNIYNDNECKKNIFNRMEQNLKSVSDKNKTIFLLCENGFSMEGIKKLKARKVNNEDTNNLLEHCQGTLLYELSREQIIKNDLDGAGKNLKKAETILPFHVGIKITLAELEIKKQNYNHAEKKLLEIRNDEEPRNIFYLSEIYRLKKDNQKEEEFREILSRESVRKPLYALKLADLYLYSGRKDLALEFYSRLNQFLPEEKFFEEKLKSIN